MNTSKTFSQNLNTLRKHRQLTVRQLADTAKVPPSLISGLSNGNRVIGELQARKLAHALQLQGEEMENFIYLAINQCSEKVLQESRNYPAEILNLIAGTLHSFGITPEQITNCVRKPRFNDTEADAAVYLDNGKSALINVEVTYR